MSLAISMNLGLMQERRNDMIPDKIYMPNELLSEEWQRHIEGEDTAYIRKDVLLKYLRNEFAIVDSYLKAQDDPVWWGQLNAFQQVIDKIESI